MKLYDGMGPNPKVVRMFLAEKDLVVPVQPVDMMKMENRQAEHLKRNPSGQVPTLETDAGTFISETTAICEYIEEKKPSPALIGTTPEQRAETRMWTRKIDLNICEPVGMGFRYGKGLKFFKDRIHCEPEMSPGAIRLGQANLKWLDDQLAGKTWIAGDRFTLADIALFCFLEFFGPMGQPLDPALKNVTAWFDRVAPRPSAKA